MNTFEDTPSVQIIGNRLQKYVKDTHAVPQFAYLYLLFWVHKCVYTVSAEQPCLNWDKEVHGVLKWHNTDIQIKPLLVSHLSLTSHEEMI